MTAFPALDRAKKLFLLRKDAEKRREENANEESDDISQTRNNSPSVEVKDRQNPIPKRQETATTHQCTRPLITFCLDFDEQLQLINSDLKLLNTSVRREYQRESLALEKLTTKLLDRNVEWLETPLKKPRYHIRVPIRKPRIKLQVVFQRKAPVAKPAINPKTLSPAALVELQTMKACVIQSSTRRYLYHCLYPGGRRQLVLASQLAIRCRFSRAYRYWRRVVTQRLKLRLRCYRAQKRIEDCRTSFARSRAFQVVETEGKYAMAKTFHHSKLLASSFSYWLRWYQNANTCPTKHPFSRKLNKRESYDVLPGEKEGSGWMTEEEGAPLDCVELSVEDVRLRLTKEAGKVPVHELVAAC